MRTLEQLVEAVRDEAQRLPFDVDEPVYRKAGKDPAHPVLFAGNLESPLCVFGRDLGRDEVAQGQPLIGAGGKLVRRGIVLTLGGGTLRTDDPWLESALDHALLTNTVPYKPSGNKAYPNRVKERFRPFVAELLAVHWRGERVVTLGTEAFRWFAPYAEPGAPEALWAREDRYEADLSCVLTATLPTGNLVSKPISVCPLPHPSPLNQRWYAAFPGLLEVRLKIRPRSR